MSDEEITINDDMLITGRQLKCRDANLECVYFVLFSFFFCVVFFREWNMWVEIAEKKDGVLLAYLPAYLFLRITFHDNPVEHINFIPVFCTLAHSREAAIDSQYTCCASGVARWKIWDVLSSARSCIFMKNLHNNVER